MQEKRPSLKQTVLNGLLSSNRQLMLLAADLLDSHRQKISSKETLEKLFKETIESQDGMASIRKLFKKETRALKKIKQLEEEHKNNLEALEKEERQMEARAEAERLRRWGSWQGRVI